MTTLSYRIVNVFTQGDDPFSGNPLCIFENGESLEASTMQALALQFNLSETTFILPATRATARVRIFTPNYEMRFAGRRPAVDLAGERATWREVPESRAALATMLGVVESDIGDRPVSGDVIELGRGTITL